MIQLTVGCVSESIDGDLKYSFGILEKSKYVFKVNSFQWRLNHTVTAESSVPK